MALCLAAGATNTDAARLLKRYAARAVVDAITSGAADPQSIAITG